MLETFWKEPPPEDAPLLRLDNVTLTPHIAGASTTTVRIAARMAARSEEHTSELQSLMRISYDVFCLKEITNRRTKVNTYHSTYGLLHADQLRTVQLFTQFIFVEYDVVFTTNIK